MHAIKLNYSLFHFKVSC